MWDYSIFKIKLTVAMMEYIAAEQPDKLKSQVKQTKELTKQKSQTKQQQIKAKKKKEVCRKHKRYRGSEGARYQREGDTTI